MQIKKYWNQSITNKLIIIIGIVWASLAILFAFYDLNISKAVVNQNSIFGKFFANFGELPGLFVGLISFFILSVNIKTSNKILKYLFLLIIWILTTILSLYFIAILLRILNLPLDFLSHLGYIPLLSAGMLTVLGMWIFQTKIKTFSIKNISIAKIGATLLSVSFIIVQILKTYWGRIRFQDLAIGYSNFTPWYSPQGNTGGHSFPSGHTMFALITLALILLVLNQKKWKKITVITIVIIWGLLVPISRVIIGAHYASDVLFSGGLTIMLFLFLYKKYYQN